MRFYLLGNTIIIFSLICLLPNLVLAEENKVLAEGKGFTITQKDVKKIKGFFEEKTHYRTDQKGYLHYAIRNRLFILKGQELGLYEKENIDFEKLPAQEIIKMEKKYVAHIVNNNKLPDKVIKSYYLAFPEKFQVSEDDKANSSSNNETQIKMTDSSSEEKKPLKRAKLDEKLRKKIQITISLLKKDSLIDENYNKLSEEYNLKVN